MRSRIWQLLSTRVDHPDVGSFLWVGVTLSSLALKFHCSQPKNGESHLQSLPYDAFTLPDSDSDKVSDSDNITVHFYGTHIRIGNKIGIGSVSVNTSLDAINNDISSS